MVKSNCLSITPVRVEVVAAMPIKRSGNVSVDAMALLAAPLHPAPVVVSHRVRAPLMCAMTVVRVMDRATIAHHVTTTGLPARQRLLLGRAAKPRTTTQTRIGAGRTKTRITTIPMPTGVALGAVVVVAITATTIPAGKRRRKPTFVSRFSRPTPGCRAISPTGVPTAVAIAEHSAKRIAV